MTDAEEKQLKQELRRKQSIWEHPRNIAILVGVAIAFGGLVFGALGYKIGQTPPPPPIIINIPQGPQP
jgi:hypothetical protein